MKCHSLVIKEIAWLPRIDKTFESLGTQISITRLRPSSKSSNSNSKLSQPIEKYKKKVQLLY